MLDDMRLIKDSHEITLMRRAAEIASQGTLVRCALRSRGKFEYEVGSGIAHEFIRRCAYPAYNHIVAVARTPVCCT